MFDFFLEICEKLGIDFSSSNETNNPRSEWSGIRNKLIRLLIIPSLLFGDVCGQAGEEDIGDQF